MDAWHSCRLARINDAIVDVRRLSLLPSAGLHLRECATDRLRDSSTLIELHRLRVGSISGQ